MIARVQIVQVLVASLSSDAARGKTFELVAVTGPAQADLEPFFAALDPNSPPGLDAVRDMANMPLAEEPQRVHDDLARALQSKAAV